MGSKGYCWNFGLAVVFMVLPLGCGSGGSGGGNYIPASTCSESFVACGGDPTGTWDIVSLCVDGDLTAAYNLQMADEYPTCANIISNATMEGRGSVTYGAGTVSYTGNFRQKFTAAYTPACVSSISSGMSLTSNACSQIQTGLNKEDGQGGTCDFTGGNCVCQLTLSTEVKRSLGYTVNETTITEVDADSYSFCVNGNTMTQREQVEGDVYGVTHLSKR